MDLALEVDLLGEGGPTQKADTLFYLSKEAFKRHLVDDLWRVKRLPPLNRLEPWSPVTP
jgi:hypothetical protein